MFAPPTAVKVCGATADLQDPARFGVFILVEYSQFSLLTRESNWCPAIHKFCNYSKDTGLGLLG